MPPDLRQQVFLLYFVIYPTVVVVQSCVIIGLLWIFKRERSRRWQSLLAPCFAAEQPTLWLPLNTREISGEGATSSCDLFPTGVEPVAAHNWGPLVSPVDATRPAGSPIVEEVSA